MCVCHCVELWTGQTDVGIQKKDVWPGGIMASTERKREEECPRTTGKKAERDTEYQGRKYNEKNRSGFFKRKMQGKGK